jgi:ABC-type Mn2+/Zn2+ transport system permease subunit
MEALTGLLTFEDYGALVSLLLNSILAAALLGIVGGLVSVFVMTRDIAFAVHGIAELSFAGAAFFLLVGMDVVLGSFVGSLLAAVIIAVGGVRDSEKNAIIGVLMPFGLGLGILFLALYDGRAANKFGLLTGQIVAISDDQLRLLVICAILVLVTLAVIWRPLMFASLDPQVALARGVRVGTLHLVFMVALGLAVALSVQVVGVLLVLPGDLLSDPHTDPVGHLRRRLVRGRCAHRTGVARRPHQPVRHDHQLRDLRRLPAHRPQTHGPSRPRPDAARVGPGPSPLPALISRNALAYWPDDPFPALPPCPSSRGSAGRRGRGRCRGPRVLGARRTAPLPRPSRAARAAATRV